MEKLKYFGFWPGTFACLFKMISCSDLNILLIVGLSLLELYFLLMVLEKINIYRI